MWQSQPIGMTETAKVKERNNGRDALGIHKMKKGELERNEMKKGELERNKLYENDVT